MAAGPHHRWERRGDSQLSAHLSNCRVWVTAAKAALPPTQHMLGMQGGGRQRWKGREKRETARRAGGSA